MQLTVTDESYHDGDKDHIWQYSLTGGDPNLFVSATGEVESDILLDSMQTGKNFETITEGKLTPGDNLRITVTFTYQNNGNIVQGEKEAVANSLFASKTNGTGTALNNVGIGNLRHLRNLDSKYFKSTDDFNVTQIRDIDFNESTWDEDSTVEFSAGKPLNPLKATGFGGITNGKLKDYYGSSNKILNLDIRGERYVGLFNSCKDMSIRSLSLVDCKATGVSFVGLLAGKLDNCTVYDCKAYLSTYDTYGRYYDNMQARLDNYTVTAANPKAKETELDEQDLEVSLADEADKDGRYAGGIVGSAENGTSIRFSLAAVNVKAYKFAGGLVGNISDSDVNDSYSSGGVAATFTNSYAGGIASTATDAQFVDCYSTSDITAQKYGGGFCANSEDCTFIDCTSYGAVLQENKSVDKNHSGAFCANAKGSSFNSCEYLQQGSYNGKFAKADYASATKYENLVDTENIGDAQSHPYSSKLITSAFPFKMLKDTKGLVIDHYGDWPMQVYLETSLVYYEKYGDDDYGFYADTSLTRDLDESGVESESGWVINSLKDQSCIEDGYALMTIYKLSDIYYSLNDKSAQANTNFANADRYQKRLTTTPKGEEVTDDTAPIIAENKSFEFKKGNLSYSISNARVYKLPFDLQMTNRYKTNRFYDRLDVTGMVGNYRAMNNYVFYYCPDFAKTAINPDVDNPSVSAAYPADPSGEQNPIYVRSARQLNALGYVPYYWNPTTASRKFYFKQESDIDFSKYTKEYFGRTYNLMDTSADNKYRNRPIGTQKNQQFTTPQGTVTNNAGSFRQTYDGMGNEIIDYRCETYTQKLTGSNTYDTYLYTGLFGKAENAVLKNIVMVASKPGSTGWNGETPKYQSSGYVISHCTDSSNPSGIGALCGCSFVDSKTSGSYNSNNETKITNCAVSGYDVAYTKASGDQLNKNYAIGGLVGFNFGSINNCSVMNKSIYFTHSDNNVSIRPAKYVGGVAGSLNGNGSIEQCSCGGYIKADNCNESYFGMIAGGCDDIPGYGSKTYDYSHFTTRVNNIKCCYSIADWSTLFLDIKDQNYRNKAINFVYMPIRKYDDNDIGGCTQSLPDGFDRVNSQTDERNVNGTKFRTLNCFEGLYLKDNLDGITVRGQDPHYNYTDDLKDCVGKTDAELASIKDISLQKVYHNDSGGKREVVNFKRASVADTHLWPITQIAAYKYPAFVSKVNADGSLGDPVYYGPLGYNGN